jgi:hypothetical protein
MLEFKDIPEIGTELTEDVLDLVVGGSDMCQYGTSTTEPTSTIAFSPDVGEHGGVVLVHKPDAAVD